MDNLCYQENLLIWFSPTSLSPPVTLTVTGVDPLRNTHRVGRGQAIGAPHLRTSFSRMKAIFQ